MATLKTLAKRLDFTQEWEYFEYMVESYANGQMSQCRALFADMSKADKKAFLVWLKEIGSEGETYDYYFSLL